MADFEKAYALTMGHEGGYANHPDDTGGETYAGIARNFNPGWSGWLYVDAVTRQNTDVARINTLLARNTDLQNRVRSFYKQQYWDVNRLDSIVSQELANELFDTGVNMGVKKAGLFLQEALNLTNVNGRAYPDTAVDGIVGKQTLELTNKHPRPALLLKVLNALQAERYLGIMRNNPSQEVFANAWFSRVAYRVT